MNILCLGTDLIDEILHLTLPFLPLQVVQLDIVVQNARKSSLLTRKELAEAANETSQREPVRIVYLAHHLEVVLRSLYDFH